MWSNQIEELLHEQTTPRPRLIHNEIQGFFIPESRNIRICGLPAQFLKRQFSTIFVSAPPIRSGMGNNCRFTIGESIVPNEKIYTTLRCNQNEIVTHHQVSHRNRRYGNQAPHHKNQSRFQGITPLAVSIFICLITEKKYGRTEEKYVRTSDRT